MEGIEVGSWVPWEGRRRAFQRAGVLGLANTGYNMTFTDQAKRYNMTFTDQEKVPKLVDFLSCVNSPLFSLQFFITLCPSPWLAGRFHHVGHITRGFQVTKPFLTSQNGFWILLKTLLFCCFCVLNCADCVKNDKYEVWYFLHKELNKKGPNKQSLMRFV